MLVLVRLAKAFDGVKMGYGKCGQKGDYRSTYPTLTPEQRAAELAKRKQTAKTKATTAGAQKAQKRKSSGSVQRVTIAEWQRDRAKVFTAGCQVFSTYINPWPRYDPTRTKKLSKCIASARP
eukprot:m.150581 g.150581  ORF g.150581 m.150581 type:complete len:122 (-) comp14265_c0_seq1:619-984(-)